MLVILEGPDGSGKTTLANTLCEEYNFNNITPVPREWPEQFGTAADLFRNLANDEKLYVMDRCFITEWIYRVVMYDKTPTINLEQIVKLLTYWSSNVYYVFCFNKNAYSNAINRGETYVATQSLHNEICKAYEFVYNTLNRFTDINLLEYDYTINSVKDLLDKLEVSK